MEKARPPFNRIIDRTNPPGKGKNKRAQNLKQSKLNLQAQGLSTPSSTHKPSHPLVQRDELQTNPCSNPHPLQLPLALLKTTKKIQQTEAPPLLYQTCMPNLLPVTQSFHQESIQPSYTPFFFYLIQKQSQKQEPPAQTKITSIASYTCHIPFHFPLPHLNPPPRHPLQLHHFEDLT